MRLIILSAFLVFCSNLYSQEQDKGLYLGPSIFPNISTGFANPSELDSEYYRGIKSSRFSYSAGFSMNYHFENNFGISTGLNFMSTGDKSLVYPPDPLRGFFFDRYYTHTENYIELPVSVYKKFENSILIKIGGSVLYNLQHKSKIFINETEGLDLDISIHENTKIGVTANIGFGYVVDLAGDQFLEIMPYAQYNFINPLDSYVYADWTPSRKFASFGIQINYLFKASGE
jgi:hypothetical protein